jgi:restriction system protein
MEIPDFQQVMLPLLKFASDGQPHKIKEAIEYIANYFELSKEQKTVMLSSGAEAIVDNRVRWARFHLKKAGVFSDPFRGQFQITKRGKDLLKSNPVELNMKILDQFEEYRAIRKGEKSLIDNEIQKQSGIEQNITITPEESIDYGFKQINDALSEEISRQLKIVTPSFFERLVVELLVKMGYGGSLKEAGEIVGKSGDSGIDGIIKEDKLGLDAVYIQAKKWEGSVGRPEIQKFAGALMGQKAKKGIFITTSIFTKDATDFVKSIESRIVLIDGLRLAELMIEHDLGVNTVREYKLKRVDSDYFIEA